MQYTPTTKPLSFVRSHTAEEEELLLPHSGTKETARKGGVDNRAASSLQSRHSFPFRALQLRTPTAQTRALPCLLVARVTAALKS